jgi:hypothetical protein
LLLFVRYKLAKIVTVVCHTDAYDTLEDSDESLLPVIVKKQKSILSPALPLVRWTHHHWTDLENLLLAASDNLIHLHNSNASTDQQQDAHFYNVDSLVRYIRVNRALSDIRWDLQEQLMKNNNDMSSNITMDPAVLATFGYVLQIVLCSSRLLLWLFFGWVSFGYTTMYQWKLTNHSFFCFFLVLVKQWKRTLVMTIKLVWHLKTSWYDALTEQ